MILFQISNRESVSLEEFERFVLGKMMNHAYDPDDYFVLRYAFGVLCDGSEFIDAEVCNSLQIPRSKTYEGSPQVESLIKLLLEATRI